MRAPAQEEFLLERTVHEALRSRACGAAATWPRAEMGDVDIAAGVIENQLSMVEGVREIQNNDVVRDSHCVCQMGYDCCRQIRDFAIERLFVDPLTAVSGNYCGTCLDSTTSACSSCQTSVFDGCSSCSSNMCEVLNEVCNCLSSIGGPLCECLNEVCKCIEGCMNICKL